MPAGGGRITRDTHTAAGRKSARGRAYTCSGREIAARVCGFPPRPFAGLSQKSRAQVTPRVIVIYGR